MISFKSKWLIIGGAGYIGSHVTRTFLKNNLDVLVLDNLSTGIKERIPPSIELIELDCSESDKVNNILNSNNIEGIVHLAALKHARESERESLKYWDKNISAMLGVIKSLKNSPVKYFLFSSSCSIYGDRNEVTEGSTPKPLSTYAKTKSTSENILNDCAKELNLSFINLRYFNVIGNDDFPMSYDNSLECLFPCLYKSLKKGELPNVFGTNFNTPDGSALRDYIDVRDLSQAHYLCAKHLILQDKKLSLNLNIGTGKPRSVIEIINAFSKHLSVPNKFNNLERNPADPDAVWANTEKFKSLFNWKPTCNLDDSIKSFVASKKLDE